MQDSMFNTDIEMSIISSLIYDPTLLNKYQNELKQELFYLPLNQKIYCILIDLNVNNKVIDETIVKEKLGKEYEDALTHILIHNPLTVLKDYLEILNDYAIKRNIKQNLLDIQVGMDSNLSGFELKQKFSTLSDSINKEYKQEIFEISNILTVEEKEAEFICKTWLPIPKRTVSIIASPGGMGKSWLVLQLAIRAIYNEDAKKAFLWLSEDPKEITKNRFNTIFTDVLKYKDKSIYNKIDISDSPTLQFIYDEQRKVEISQYFYTFKIMLEEYDLIILDPLIAFYGTDENSNASARRFMQLFTEWAKSSNKTIIFVHHSTKNTTQSRGASAFVDAVRVVYEINLVKDKNDQIVDPHLREIKITKDNYGAKNFLTKSTFKREIFPKNIKLDAAPENKKYSDF